MEIVKRILKKIVAVLVAFVIIMSQYVVTGLIEVTYAIDLLATQSNNVQFRAYFKNGEEELTEIERSIDAKDLKLRIDISVKNEGYFKGQISLENAGFKITQAAENNYINKVENGVIFLNQINAEETASIEVGIECIDEEKIEVATLNKDTTVKLNGTYTFSGGNISIDSGSSVKVVWNIPEGTKAELSAMIQTNSIYKVGDENKKIVQFLISSDLTNNGYPIKSTEITATKPEGATKVEVHKRTTKATNGEQDFTEANNVIQEGNNVTIKVENNETEGKISWLKGVKDIFVVTYEYPANIDLSTQNILINSKIITYSKDKTTGNNIELNGEQVQLQLNETKDRIASVIKEEEESQIYKGKIYSGEDREFTSYTLAYVDYVEGIKEIEIKEEEAKYAKEVEENGENKTVQSDANVEIKSIKISKLEVERVLGETWSIKIGESTITNETEVDANGNIEVLLPDGTKSSTIKTSKPVNNGFFAIETKKTIKNTTHTREEKKEFTMLEDICSVKYIKNDDGQFTHKYTYKIGLKDTESKASMQSEQQALVASENMQPLNLTVVLESKGEKQDLYKNPTIKIKLPNQIENVTFAQKPQIMYADEKLTLADGDYTINEENGQKIINIKLTGEQTSYLGETVQGITVQIKTNVKVKNNATDSQEDIILNYTNENATKYTDQGIEKTNIQIVANPTQGQNQEQNQGQNQSENNNQNTLSDLKLELTAKVGGKTINRGETVKAGEIIAYTAKIKNTGNIDETGLILEAEIPENTKMIEVNQKYPSWDEQMQEYGEDEDYLVTKEGNTFRQENINIEKGKELEYSIMVKVDENISIEKSIQVKATIKKDEQNKKEDSFNNIVNPSKFVINCIPLFRRPDQKLLLGYSYKYRIEVKNLSNEVQKNLKFLLNQNSNIDLVSIDYKIGDDYKGEFTLDNNTKIFDSIPANESLYITVVEKTKSKVDNTNENQRLQAILSAQIIDSTNTTYTSNELQENIESVVLNTEFSAEIISSEKNKNYVSPGDKIKYTYRINNVGSDDAAELNIEDNFSKYLNLTSLTLNGNTNNYEIEELTIGNLTYDRIKIKTELKAKKEVLLEIIGEVKNDLPIEENLTVINKANISNNGVIVDETKQIEYTVKNGNNNEDGEQGNNEGDNQGANDGEDSDNKNGDNNSPSDKNENSIPTSKAIVGKAWLDENKDGKRDDNENLLSGIKVSLMNIENSKIVDTTETNSNGSYQFTNLNSGKYIVLFEYDSGKYMLTAYKAEGVGTDINSDVELVTMTINGERKNVAATDTLTINSNVLNNIDIGLKEAKVFDLHISKTISKVKVSNAQGNKTIKYSDTNLAKVEIKGKYLSNSIVTVEYKIRVKNNGEIAGYAKKIIDYKPKDLKFDSNLNPDWIKQGDQLYSTKLENTKIEPGETKEIKLILTKKMTNSNTGLTNNRAEIAEYYNEQGIIDKNLNEDDLGQADLIISVSTGRIIGYITITLILIIALAIISYIILKRELKKHINF